MTTDTREKTPPLLLTARAVAEMLSLSERTIWRLVSTGELPRPMKLGHSCRWSRKSIETFVGSRTELKEGGHV